MREQHLGAGTCGVWTAADARAAGLTRDEVRRRRERGEWQVLRRGVYCDGGVQPSPVMRAWAAVLAAGGPDGARAAGRTAARLLDLPLIDDDDPLLPAAERQAPHDDIVVRRALDPRPTLHPARLRLHVTDLAMVEGCPTLAVPRLLLDLARLLHHEALVCAVDAALHRRLVDRSELHLLLERCRGRAGAGRLRAAVDVADGRAESPLETLGRLVLLPVMPGLTPQVRVRDAAGRVVARLDLGDPVLGLGLEGDGKRGHAGTHMVAKDRQRERRLHPYGWELERYTWTDVRRDREQLRARVSAAAAGRRRAAERGMRPRGATRRACRPPTAQWQTYEPAPDPGRGRARARTLGA